MGIPSIMTKIAPASLCLLQLMEGAQYQRSWCTYMTSFFILYPSKVEFVIFFILTIALRVSGKNQTYQVI